jgi:WD40 repeat protein
MKGNLITACLASIGCWCAAAQPSLRPSVIAGIVFDAPSQSVRPVVGFPGSAYLGEPMLKQVDGAFIAPDADSALIVESETAVFVRGLHQGETVKVPIADATLPIDQAAWTEDSTAVAAYSSATQSIRVYRLTPSSVRSGTPIDLSFVTGEVTSVAVNSDGSQIVIGVRDAVDGGLYAVSETMPVSKIMASSDPGAAVFAKSSNTLFAIDRASRQVVRFRHGVNEGPDTLSLTGEDALTDAVGIALSSDERKLYLAGGADQCVRTYDIQTGQLMQEVQSSAPPAGLLRLSGSGSVFALGARAGNEQPLWIFDSRTASSVFFVPAAPIE